MTSEQTAILNQLTRSPDRYKQLKRRYQRCVSSSTAGVVRSPGHVAHHGTMLRCGQRSSQPHVRNNV